MFSGDVLPRSCTTSTENIKDRTNHIAYSISQHNKYDTYLFKKEQASIAIPLLICKFGWVLFGDASCKITAFLFTDRIL